MAQELLDGCLFDDGILHGGGDHDGVTGLLHSGREAFQHLGKEWMKQRGYDDPNLRTFARDQAACRKIWPIAELLRFGQYTLSRLGGDVRLIPHNLGHGYDRNIQRPGYVFENNRHTLASSYCNHRKAPAILERSDRKSTR